MKDRDSFFSSPVVYGSLSLLLYSMSYIAFWVSEEDKSNNKKNPALSLSREAIYLTAYTHQHRPKQVSINKKRKNFSSFVILFSDILQ
jgi:hypothetical protein